MELGGGEGQEEPDAPLPHPGAKELAGRSNCYRDSFVGRWGIEHPVAKMPQVVHGHMVASL